MPAGERNIDLSLNQGSNSKSSEVSLKQFEPNARLVGVYFGNTDFTATHLLIQNAYNTGDTPHDYYKPDGNRLVIAIPSGKISTVGINPADALPLEYVTLTLLDAEDGSPVNESAAKSVSLVISNLG